MNLNENENSKMTAVISDNIFLSPSPNLLVDSVPMNFLNLSIDKKLNENVTDSEDSEITSDIRVGSRSPPINSTSNITDDSILNLNKNQSGDLFLFSGISEQDRLLNNLNFSFDNIRYNNSNNKNNNNNNNLKKSLISIKVMSKDAIEKSLKNLGNTGTIKNEINISNSSNLKFHDLSPPLSPSMGILSTETDNSPSPETYMHRNKHIRLNNNHNSLNFRECSLSSPRNNKKRVIAPLIDLNRFPRPIDRDRPKSPESDTDIKKGCNCKKSRCLKLYCECFSHNEVCAPNCNCVNCANTQENNALRSYARKTILERDPLAFQTNNKIIGQNTKGCNCKKSACLKKYCECFQAGIECNHLCKCVDCHNCKNRKMSNSKEDKTLLSQSLKITEKIF